MRLERKRGTWWRRWRGGHVALDVELPRRADVSVDTAGGSITLLGLEGRASLDTSGGSIEVADLQGPLEADTSGGSIRLRRVTGDVALDTSGGSILAEGVGGSVHADTSGGDIRLEQVAGAVRAETSGGSIVIAGAEGRVEAETSGGSIEAAFAPGNEAGGVLSTAGGSIVVPRCNVREGACALCSATTPHEPWGRPAGRPLPAQPAPPRPTLPAAAGSYGVKTGNGSYGKTRGRLVARKTGQSLARRT